MDFSSDFAVNMILNIIGYVAAGALSLVIFSMFRKPRADFSPGTPDDGGRNGFSDQILATAGRESELQFVRLGQTRSRVGISSERIGEHTGSTADTPRNHRADIIKIARRMIKAGATNEKIKKVLPISEAELSLLSLNGIE
ncbi:MAG: hypothetical protein U9R56_01055 [candidate division Zixibacteria bacterium]|nr:hypothetical protein [candidate division Zixibacteria bacterium]